MSTTTLSVRTDKDVKERASQIYKELGLNISTATNMFYLATIRENGLPISTTLDEVPNKETADAIAEGRILASDKNARTYDSFEDFEKRNGILVDEAQNGPNEPLPQRFQAGKAAG